MEIRTVKIYRDDLAPFTGQGLCVVVSKDESTVQLFYPPTFDEFTMRRYDRYLKGEVQEYGFESSTTESDLYWPTNNTGQRFEVEKMVDLIYRRVEFFASLGRSLTNVRTVVRILSELSGTPLEIVQERVAQLMRSANPSGLVSSSGSTTKTAAKLSCRYRVNKKLPKFNGRRGTIIQVMRELGDASMLQITEACRGRLQTKSDLKRTVTFFVNELVRKQMAVEVR